MASREWAGRFGRFLVAGLVATAVQYLVLMVGVEALDARPARASAAGFVLGAVVGYLLNRSYTFGSRVGHAVGAARFATVAAVGLLGNVLFMVLLTGYLHLHYVLAQVLATGVVMLWNFAANALWTFRRT